MRRFLSFIVTIVFGITLALVLLIWAGPLTSGAFFLTRSTGQTPVSHVLSHSYESRHQGHVDVPTGLYIREDEDLTVSGTPPFALTRTHLSGDRISRSDGVGATNNAEWYLIGDAARFQWAELILADGGCIHFDRISWGTSLCKRPVSSPRHADGILRCSIRRECLDHIIIFNETHLRRTLGGYITNYHRLGPSSDWRKMRRGRAVRRPSPTVT
jgi:hypothetical protein